MRVTLAVIGIIESRPLVLLESCPLCATLAKRLPITPPMIIHNGANTKTKKIPAPPSFLSVALGQMMS
jgi:hypothetical protein